MLKVHILKQMRPIPVIVIGTLLVAGTIVNYISRQAFSIVAPAAQAALPISIAQTAKLFQAFLLFYTFTPLLWGYLIDRKGIRWVYGGVVLVWSFLQLGYVFAHSFHEFLLLQILLGATESANFVACSKATAVWCLPRQRARLSGFIQAASVIGAVLTPPLCALAIKLGGWRHIFVWNAVVAFLWVVVWLAIYRDPDRNLKTIVVPGALHTEQPISVVQHPKELVTVLVVVRWLSDPVWWFYLLWLPTYLVQKKVATAANVGESLWIPYVGAALGAMLAGVASDKLIRASGRTVSSRLKIMFCSVVIMPVGILVLRAETLWGVLAVLCAVLAGHMAWKTNLTALTADCFPGRIVGRVESLFSVGSGLGGMMFFVYVGAIVEKFSYTPIFVILAVVHPCAFFLLWLTLRHVDPPQCSLAPPSMSNRYAERGPAM